MFGLDDLKARIEKLEADAVRAVHIIILRETVAAELSRLMTLDPDNAGRYSLALQELE